MASERKINAESVEQLFEDQRAIIEQLQANQDPVQQQVLLHKCLFNQIEPLPLK